MKKLILVLLVVLTSMNIYGQSFSKGTDLLSFVHSLHRINDKVNFSSEKLYSFIVDYKDEIRKGELIGYIHKLAEDVFALGGWDTISQEELVFKVRFSSTATDLLMIYFNKFSISNGTAYAYHDEKKNIKGLYYLDDNRIGNQFAILEISGGDIILELTVRVSTELDGLSVLGIGHIITSEDGDLEGPNSSGSCNVDVVCLI